MAGGDFNPEVKPVQDTNFMNWSRPIQQPRAIGAGASLGVAAREAGQLMTEGVKVADYFEKKSIEHVEQTGLEKLRDQQSANLESLLSDVKSGKAPPELEHLTENLENLQSWRGNNKASMTAYKGRLDTYLKDLRSQYPGYRDYIDSVAHETLNAGLPANQKVQSMLGDLNSFIQKAGEQKGKAESLLDWMTKEGVPGTPAMDKAYHAGKASLEDIRGVAYRYGNMMFEHKMILQTMAERKLETEYQQDKARAKITGMASDRFAHAADTIMISAGMGNSPISLRNFFAKTDPNSATYDPTFHPSPDTLEQVKAALASTKTSVTEGLRKELHADPAGPDDPIKKRNAPQLLGDEAVDQSLAAAGKGYDMWMGLITDQHFGMANFWKNLTQGRTDYTLAKMTGDPNVGPNLLIGHAIAGFTKGSNYPEIVTRLMYGNSEYNTMDATKLSALHTQIATGLNLLKPNQVLTYKDGVEQLKDTGEKDPSMYKGLIDGFTHALASPEASVDNKTNAMKSAYDPANRQMLLEFDLDSKGGVYSQFTSPVARKVLKKIGNQELNQNALDWSASEFGDIFGSTVKRLPDYNSERGFVIWDSDHGAFKYQEGRDQNTSKSPHEALIDMGKDILYGRRNVDAINSELKRVNTAIVGLKGMCELVGGDCNSIIIQHMLDMGLSTQTPGLPGQLIQAFIAAHQQKPKEESTE